jgi:hypothetical protein
VILALAAFWYGLVPVAGAFMVRRSWRRFRRRFDELRLRPLLDYAACRQGEEGRYQENLFSGNLFPGNSFRFIGGFESITDGHTLWIRSDKLTIPVSLAGALTYVLPMPEHPSRTQKGGVFPALKSSEIPEGFDPGKETPQRIKWDQLTALTEGAKVFVGGTLRAENDRLTFVSTRDNPLLVIFYDGPDRSLTARAIRAGRQGNEYWNRLTPYAFILGAFSQTLMVLGYIQRPAFQLTVMAAFVAMCIPLLTLIPPGFIFTVLYRRLWWQARVFRAYRDLVLLPLKYLPGKKKEAVLPDGERYGGVYYKILPPESRAKIETNEIPLLIPEKAAGRVKDWYIFGAFPNGDDEVTPPQDVFATYGAIPGDPGKLARNFTLKAYVLEVISWVLLLAGISLNAFFIGMIIVILR